MKNRIIRYLKFLFCIFFFLLCLSPVFILDKITVSKQENRKLSAFPSLWNDGVFNDKFSDQYETYLKDHFPNRLNFIKYYYHSQYSLMTRIENEEAFIGDDGWMFSFWATRDRTISNKRWELKMMERSAENFIKFVKNKKHIDFYFFLIPMRAEIYHQYWDKHFANRRHISVGKEFKKHFSDYPNVKVFYPYEQLKALSKKDVVFWKHDIHLYGKVGLQPLIETFVKILQTKYFPQVSEYSKVEYGQGMRVNAHYADILFLDMDREMTSYKPVSGEYISIEDNLYDGMTASTINLNSPSDKTVLIAGNCYAESTFAQLRELFHRAILYRYNTAKKISSEKKLSLDDIDVIVVAVPEDMNDTLKFLDTLGKML